ncbi:hypothetical protein DICA3_C06678 [Diutina catenulata]
MSGLQIQQSALPSPHVTTSLTEATHHLSSKPPCRVFMKNDLEQPSGSFKLRGIGNLIHSEIEAARARRCTKEIQVFASSGGNAGLAAAYAAHFYGVKCTVVMPVIAKESVKTQLKSYNSEMVLFGNNIFEADQHLRNILESIDNEKILPIYCHPFDNPKIWEGHATLVDELMSQFTPHQVSKLKGIVCSCGGGGLYNGIYQGLERNGVQDSEILLIETAQAPTLSETIKADKLITLSSVKSMATSLACSYTTQTSLDNFKNDSVVTTKLEVIDDVDALKGCIDYHQATGKVVEPACGASASVVFSRMDLMYKHFGHLQPDDIVVIVVCGGSCTTENDLSSYQGMVNRATTKL